MLTEGKMAEQRDSELTCPHGHTRITTIYRTTVDEKIGKTRKDYMWNLKNRVVNIAKNQTHIYREKTNGYQWDEEEGDSPWGREVKGTNYYVQN